jgi:hypothetical protein
MGYLLNINEKIVITTFNPDGVFSFSTQIFDTSILTFDGV